MKKIISIIVVMLFAITTYAQQKNDCAFTIKTTEHNVSVMPDNSSMHKINTSYFSLDKETIAMLKTGAMKNLTEEQRSILAGSKCLLVLNSDGQIDRIYSLSLKPDAYAKLSQDELCNLCKHIQTLRVDKSKIKVLEPIKVENDPLYYALMHFTF